MKRDTTNYFAVGLFVLAGLIVLAVVLYRLGGGSGDRDSYFTHYRNVAGLAKGTLVTYEGFVFGHVAGIQPQRGEGGVVYEVELKVHRGWKIPADSIARIYSEGLLADTVINIAEGESERFLEPGGKLSGAQGVDLFAAMGRLAADFNDLSEGAIRPMIESVNHSVDQVGGELQSRVPIILDDVQNLVAKLDTSATYLAGIINAETEQKAQRILDNVDVAAKDLRSLSQGLAEVRRDSLKLVRDLDRLVTDSRPDLQQSVADLRQILEQVSRYSEDILLNLDNTSRNMSEFSRQIRNNPGRLLGGPIPLDAGVRRD